MDLENVEQDARAAKDSRSYTDGAAFVDGRFLPVGEARVPILDWGFLRSDATYDVAHVWRGSFFRLEDHLDRFARSTEHLRLSPPYGRREIRDILVECVRLSGLRDAYAEVICTRGVPRPGSRDPRDCENLFYVFAVHDGFISTPDRGVLEGITRRTVIELSAEHGIPLETRPVPADELRSADEVFISSTAGGIIPVTTVDGEAIGDGEPGPV